MITEQQVYAAGHEVARAEAAVAEARPRRWTSPKGRADYKAAEAALASAQTRLGERTTQWEAQQLYATERPEREKAAAKDIVVMGKELAASRKKVSAAAASAQQALLDLADAAQAHNALVDQHGAALTVRGLGLEPGQDHETGATRDCLRLRGTWWMPVDVTTLLDWVAKRVRSSKVPHGTMRLISSVAANLDQRSDQLLDEVPAPPEPKPVPRVYPKAAPLERTVTRTDLAAAERHLREELLGWTQPVFRDGEMVGSRGCEAPENVKRSVAHRLAQLREQNAA